MGSEVMAVHFYNLCYMWSASRLGRFTPGERVLVVCWRGGFMSPRVGLDALESEMWSDSYCTWVAGLQEYDSDCLLARSGCSVLTLLADSQHNYYDKYLLLCMKRWDSWWWTVDLSETFGVLYQNKIEK